MQTRRRRQSGRSTARRSGGRGARKALCRCNPAYLTPGCQQRTAATGLATPASTPTRDERAREWLGGPVARDDRVVPARCAWVWRYQLCGIRGPWSGLVGRAVLVGGDLPVLVPLVRTQVARTRRSAGSSVWPAMRTEPSVMTRRCRIRGTGRFVARQGRVTLCEARRTRRPSWCRCRRCSSCGCRAAPP